MPGAAAIGVAERIGVPVRLALALCVWLFKCEIGLGGGGGGAPAVMGDEGGGVAVEPLGKLGAEEEV